MTKQSKAQEFNNAIMNEIRELAKARQTNFYPVGSIYTSVNSTNPSELFGGTWVQIKDTFLLGSGDTYTADSFDKNIAQHGEATHTLSEGELPNHNHEMITKAVSGWTTNGQAKDNMQTSAAYTWESSNVNVIYSPQVTYAGNGQAHNNMPPYLIVYMWKRTE